MVWRKCLRVIVLSKLKSLVYIGAKVVHKGTHNLIQVESYVFGGTTTRGNNYLVYQGCQLYGS